MEEAVSKQTSFSGPIFIVGLPRSGTKLLRGLLNNHTRIHIPGNESHIIPYFYNNRSQYGNLAQVANFQKFYDDFSNSIFFKRLARATKVTVTEEEWRQAVKDWSLSGVLETFYQFYTTKKRKDIWGDKTPAYLARMPLLKTLFPTAKFIHIIRDVRDYCLSINKAWSKNMIRAAQRWHDDILKAQRDATNFQADYIQIHYEALCENPETVLKSICEFLEIGFEPKMAIPSHPTENIGDARGAVGIVRNNSGKWRRQMPQQRVKRIEQICGSLLKELDYEVNYTGPPQRVGATRMFYYSKMDAFNLLRFQLSNYKLKEALFNYTKAQKFHK